MEVARTLFDERVCFASEPYEALEGADALVVVTEWLVYRNPDFERMKKSLRNPLVFDGRNLYKPELMERLGFEYYAIGRRGQPRPA
jgi:UDPglucose 6-dehydrogenase